MKNCIMAFGTHADDIELQAGGTLAKYVHMGYRMVYVMVTNNASGCIRTKDGDAIPEKVCSPEEKADIRRKEAVQAAKVLGAKETIFLDFTHYNTIEHPSGREPILMAPNIEECIAEVSDLIIKSEPKIVLTHSMDDQNPEHCATCILVYKAYKKAMEKVELGALFSWEPGTASRIMGMAPDTYIDITDFFDKKKEALYKHESQMNRCLWRWEYAETKAKFRAKEMDASGAIKYAEAFKTLINAFILGEHR